MTKLKNYIIVISKLDFYSQSIITTEKKIGYTDNTNSSCVVVVSIFITIPISYAFT